jgi:RNA polymerase sporulation-specific sigma factor
MIQHNKINSNNQYQQPLSDEDTDIYLKLASMGDVDAIKTLTEHNLRLVALLSKRYETATYNNPYIELNDLISIGTIGLIKAIKSFDINKNTRLATYASHCIENEILMVLRNNKKLAQTVSLETVLDEDNNGFKITIEDTLSSKDDIEDNYIKREIYKRIREQLTNLTLLEKRVAYMRFELKLDQKRVAYILHISRSYVSRIESKLIGKLAKKLQKEGLIFVRKVTDEMEKLKNMTIEDRALYLADIFINTNTTIDRLATQYNISKGTICHYFRCVLKKINPPIYENVLNKQHMQKTKVYK